MDYSPKRLTEAEIFTVDYSARIATGETITSAAWSITVVDGVDASATAMIQGAYSISGSQVSQMIGAGIAGMQYAPICTARTSLGQVLVLPDYGDGLLAVTL